MQAECRILIFIPTYNERGNVEQLCREIFRLGLDADLLFIDDNSPDGTGEILDRLAKEHQNLHVVHRPRKLGIGSAHLDGIRWGYRRGYRIMITMDSDFAHSPKYILDLMRRAEACDMVVGSRYLREDSLADWNLWRRSLTVTGHLLTRHLLKIKYDATGAFRLYRLDRIPETVFGLVRSRGYSFFFESLYVLHVNGFSIREVPMVLPARTYGHSKQNIAEVWRSVKHLANIFLARTFNPGTFKLAGGTRTQISMNMGNEDHEGWEAYWRKKQNASHRLYDWIAAFYRKNVIRPSLNRFIDEYFPKGSQLLHAGCGSGQVDVEIRNRVSIIALDLSLNALEKYRSTSNNSCKMVHGNIMAIPMNRETVDGIYNLGVMEHFTTEEIGCILKEFHRVLKPDGKVILFWPPKFGLTTNFLDMIHFIANRIAKRNLKLHPPEISRIESKEQVRALCEKADFRVVDYYFGARDLFTQVVVVLAKTIRCPTLKDGCERKHNLKKTE